MATIGQLILLHNPRPLDPASGYLPCDGRVVLQTEYPALYNVIGTSYGGTSTAFNLPNLPRPPGLLAPANFHICANGTSPSLADPYACVGRAVQFAFQPSPPLPTGWTRPANQQTIPSNCLPCDGRTLSISEHRPLYATIGATYGGNGDTTFQLPNIPNAPSLNWGMPHQGFCIIDSGLYYPDSEDDYIGQIILAPTPSGAWALPFFDYDPTDLLPCSGNLYALEQYTALFSLIGANYGGNGKFDFATPMLAPPAGLSGHSYFIRGRGLYPSMS